MFHKNEKFDTEEIYNNIIKSLERSLQEKRASTPEQEISVVLYCAAETQMHPITKARTALEICKICTDSSIKLKSGEIKGQSGKGYYVQATGTKQDIQNFLEQLKDAPQVRSNFGHH